VAIEHPVKNLRSIDADKVEFYLKEAGVPPAETLSTPETFLIRRFDDALTLNGLTSENLSHIDEALSEQRKSLNLSPQMSIGIAAIGIVGSAGVIDLFIRAGGSLGDIIVNNIDSLFTETTFHLLQNGMLEVVLNLPGGTMALAQGVANLAAHPGEIMDGISLTMQYGVHFFDALDAAGLGADLLELSDALTTVGISLLLTAGVRAYLKYKYEPMLRDKERLFESEKKKYLNLLKLRHALKSRLPARVVVNYLDSVEKRHWGF
jgi:hypothetical protein